MQVSAITSKITRQIGVHKIPRYLYHFTTPEAYNNIQKTGKLLPGNFDQAIGRNVFMVELANFFKRWNYHEFWDNDAGLGANLKAQLLDKIASNRNQIVMLRIPTLNLDTSKLKIRSQEQLFKADRELWLLTEGMNYTPEERSRYLADFLKDKPHLRFGDLAKKAKLYKQRKESIEYLYPQTISAEHIQKIAQIDLEKSIELNRDKKFPMRCIFTELLKNTPEEPALQNIRC